VKSINSLKHDTRSSMCYRRSLTRDIVLRIFFHLAVFIMLVMVAVYYFAIIPYGLAILTGEKLLADIGGLIMLGALAGTTIIAIGLIRQRIVKPLRGFIFAIEKISQGSTDFSLPDDRSDEIGRLALVFRRMMNAVRDQERLLQEGNRQLEEKVDLATQELRVALDESQRSQSILFGQQRILSAIATNSPIYESLNLIKIVYEEVMPHSICLLMLMDKDGSKLNIVHSVYYPEKFFGALDGVQLGSQGGICGLAAAQRQYCSALHVNAEFSDPIIREQLSLAGVVSGWSQPIVSQSGILFGVLTVFYTIIKEPNTDEIRFADMLADLAAIALERSRAQEELINTRDQAQHAARAKSDFLANMSHEIRTPMNGIMGLTELALDIPVDNEVRGYLEMIRDSSHSLMQIISDVLDFSKADAQRLVLEDLEFDLYAFVERTLSVLSIRARQKQLVFLSKIEPHVPRFVKGDVTRLGQILNNLVSNAIKFTNRDGAIFVYIDCPKGGDQRIQLNCAVTDTGIGVPLDKQELIFDVFTQVDSSTTRRYGGTGLGLSICRQLAQLMGGDIWLKSKQGVGSAFHFTITMTQVEQLSVEQQSHTSKSLFIGARTPEFRFAEPLSGDRAKRVLIADDNPVNLLLVMRILQSFGVEVTGVDDGLAVLQELQSAPFDLILMDCQMPQLDGYATTKAIREAEGSSRAPIPIIALTASDRVEDYKHCLDVGMNDYLPKPFERYQLLEKVSGCIGELVFKEYESSSGLKRP
jgi:signal transduction histidine kinase/ActR/RegA family two-component response regulator